MPEEERPGVQICSKPAKTKFVSLEFSPLLEKVWGETSGTKKGKEKVDSGKSKTKGPTYKLHLDIETSIDLKGVLEERILDAKIEFTLREALGIAKKDFHELIIDIIKRKRQITVEAVMIHALDTHMTEKEKMEIGEVFALMVKPRAQSQEATVDEKVSIRSLQSSSPHMPPSAPSASSAPSARPVLYSAQSALSI